MNFTKWTLAILAFVLIATLPLAGQTAMTRTTLSAAVTATQNFVTVASATGVAAPGLPVGGIGTPSGSTAILLYVDSEALEVTNISGTTVTVRRGTRSTAPAGHASGSIVWVGPASRFASSAPSGTCTTTPDMYLPKILPATHQAFWCLDSVWEPVILDHIGTPSSGVFAVEQGDGRHHVTRLLFTSKTVGSPVAQANLAIGTSLYTLPAGAEVISTAYMTLTPTCTGAVITADTPDVGLGTTVGSGAQALLSGVGAGAENIITGQTATNVNSTAITAGVSNQILTVASGDSHVVYLNAADGWAGADTLVMSGTVVIEWTLQK